MARGGGEKRKRPPAGAGNLRRGKATRRKENRFGAIIAVLAIPLLALAAFWLWQQARTSQLSTQPDRPVAASKPLNLVALLRSAGVEARHIHRRQDGFVVETTLDPSVLAARLRRRSPRIQISESERSLSVAEDEKTTTIELRRMQVVDSGAGLVEADDVTPVETERAERVKQPSTAAVPAAKQPPPAAQARPSGIGTIALVLDDVGFDRQPLERAAAIDAALSFAVIPQTPNAVSAANMLSARGFEILCHLPMEPQDYPRMNPGAGAIMTSMPAAEIRTRTLAGLRAIPHARGVNNHMGSRATADDRVMREFLAAVHDEGFFYVDSRTSPASVATRVAHEMKVPTVARNVFLDDVEQADAIRRQLAELARLAEKNGSAVGIGHLYPVTVSVLAEEIPRLKQRGFRFVPVSHLTH